MHGQTLDLQERERKENGELISSHATCKCDYSGVQMDFLTSREHGGVQIELQKKMPKPNKKLDKLLIANVAFKHS